MLSIRDDRRPERPQRPGFTTRILILLITLLLVLLAACGGKQAETSEAELEKDREEILSWLKENTNYEIPSSRPTIIFESLEEINKRYYRTAYLGQENIGALFTHKNETIHLQLSYDGKKNKNVLVHELKHWLQKTSGDIEDRKSECSKWMEVEAYETEAEWMRDYLYPEKLITHAEAFKMSNIRFCEQWIEILHGLTLWDLTGTYYCTERKFAEEVWRRNGPEIQILAGALLQDIIYARGLCWFFHEGDVGYVSELIDSAFTDDSVRRFAKVLVRNASDMSRFTRTVFVVSTADFHPPKLPEEPGTK